MNDLSRAARREHPGGFAIPAAVFVIVIVSLLALAGLYVARNNATANTGLRYSLKALYAADAGATSQLADWDRSTRLLNPGDSTVTGWRDLEDGSRYSTTILRVDDGTDPFTSLFRMRTVGRPGAGLTAQRIVTTMVRVDRANGLCCDAAIKTQGQLRIVGTSEGVKVSGLDTAPIVWGGECPGTFADKPGITLQNDDELQISGHPILEGEPPILEDSSIVRDDFSQFGDVSYEELARAADKQFPGGEVYTSIEPDVVGGECVESTFTNWGDPVDPTGACFDYLPTIHVSGNLKLSGNGIGQGILLVDGNLEITGTFDFYGIVLVQGQADFKGTTNINGGILVRNGVSAGDEASLRGGTTLQYSSCAAGRALSHAIVAQPLAGRHWFEAVE
ncbi:MAG: hypothetical protein GWN99_15030 [Gemmatimonadetes bacterium]|uniref:Type 4 fimbrial biogenesis protein PilX N-terminal domain-containing protein n=1 Tax=Candidatus Kutchimonas denitrificans TaxID=3056748 RepID=A0AAE5CCR9_9BACT|nr:hypothetical protein [Gemmatimonadota bacterium]NIR76338.1 hypothetical protein [Candidatus Kutchimonas denitrificans]NIS02361.1 hypothetical protein [Gemmatimonadota bacterium]NIT68180.1 hypothetical protein [Gemmatimonadota bacterium]NIU54404.1 hypothetical protein [Gemmatimonadota bacterium]